MWTKSDKMTSSFAFKLTTSTTTTKCLFINDKNNSFNGLRSISLIIETCWTNSLVFLFLLRKSGILYYHFVTLLPLRQKSREQIVRNEYFSTFNGLPISFVMPFHIFFSRFQLNCRVFTCIPWTMRTVIGGVLNLKSTRIQSGELD